MTTNKNTGLDNRFFGIDDYRFVNIDERYGDEVPVEIQDYMRFNPEGHFFEWLDGIYEEVDGVGVKVAVVRLPCLGEGELPVVSRDFVESVMDTICIEGGVTNCWAWLSDYDPEKLEFSLRVRMDEEEGKICIYRVTEEVIRRGVRIILSGETDVPLEAVRLYAREWRYLDVDPVDADAVIQVGLFGRVIFGQLSYSH